METTVRAQHVSENGAQRAEDAGGKMAAEIRDCPFPPATRLPRNGLERCADVWWFAPALRTRLDPSVREELARIEALAPNLPERARQLWWDYRTHVVAAVLEMEEAEKAADRQAAEIVAYRSQRAKKIDEEHEGLRKRRAELETEESGNRAKFGRYMSDARLFLAADGPIRASQVEDALDAAAPGTVELAGEHGIVPVPDRDSPTLGGLLHSLVLGAVAPVVSGFFAAVCLGTLTGFLSLDELKRGDDVAALCGTGLLGMVVVLAIGETCKYAAFALARHLEARRLPRDGVRDVPRLQGRAVTMAWVAVACILVAAEIAVEAVGIRQLHLEAIVAAKRDNVDGGSPLPFAVYVLIGTVVSAAFLSYKSIAAWNEASNGQREAWLLFLRFRWLQDRRGRADVQNAARAASQAERIAREIARVDSRLEALEAERKALDEIAIDAVTQERLDYATAAAIAETNRLHLMVGEILEAAEEERRHKHAQRS